MLMFPVSGNVLTNDDDAEGDIQTVTSPTVTTAQGVTVTIAPDGSYTYTPLPGFVGEDSLNTRYVMTEAHRPATLLLFISRYSPSRPVEMSRPLRTPIRTPRKQTLRSVEPLHRTTTTLMVTLSV